MAGDLDSTVLAGAGPAKVRQAVGLAPRAAFKQAFNAAVVAFFARTMPAGVAVSSQSR